MWEEEVNGKDKTYMEVKCGEGNKSKKGCTQNNVQKYY